MIVPFIIISITNALIMFKLMNSFSFKMKRNSDFRIQKASNSKRNYRTVEITDMESFSYSSNINQQKRQTLTKISHSINNNRHNKSSTNKETTKTLVIIASTFLLLNFPIAGTKTFYFLKSSNTDSEFTGAELFYQVNNKNLTTNQSYMNDLINWSYSSTNSTILIDISPEKLKSSNESFINKTTFIEVLNNHVVFNQKKELLERIASLIYYINFSINFFLYTFNTKQFRDIFFHIFQHSK